MIEIIKMTVDLEFELDLGEITDDGLSRFKEMAGFDLLDKNGNVSKESIEWEKQGYIEGLREDLESMDYKVTNIYNYKVEMVD